MSPDSPILVGESISSPDPVVQAEAPVKEFFDGYAEVYAHSWDRRAHGLHVGIFPDEPASDTDDDAGLEDAYQRSRDHVVELLERIRPLEPASCVLDVCCGSGVTLGQIVGQRGCSGVGVDISTAQLALARRFGEVSDGKTARRTAFLQGSASRIRDVASVHAPFTHVFSQDGLLFACDKQAAIRGIFDLLAPGGSLVISDFSPQISKEQIDAAVRARVYDDVKWGGGLSFTGYLELLNQAGFEIVQAELRPADMRATYRKLVTRARAMAKEEGETYTFLAERYAGIVKAIDTGALSWAWMAARKR